MYHTKICTKCQEEKPANLEFFTKRGDKLGSHCRECHRSYKQNPQPKKDYYYRNRTKCLQGAKARQLEKVDEIREYKKQYYQKNKEKIKARTVENIRKRRNNDPLFRVVESLRANLYNALNGKAKGQRTLDYLTIDIDEFKRYIEGKFQNGMNWDNYGEWHLDHIRPICLFDHSDEEQIKECWHYTNFQPLWKEDNLKKSNNFP